MQPRLVFQNDNLAAVAKPFGMPSQPDPSGDLSLLTWVQEQLNQDAHLLHRLDRPTGGLVLFSKNRASAKEMSHLFQERRVAKEYLAICEGRLEQGELELSHYIGKLPGKNFVRAYDKPVRNSKAAELALTVLGRSEGLLLLKVRPKTGRRHQIRAQLRTVGLSILGDQKYGKSKPLPGRAIALWSHSAEFECSSGHHRLCCNPPLKQPWSQFEAMIEALQNR